MPTKEELRTRLIDKLRELFQLDKPDLDFGFYRIMHAKAEQVSDFLEKDLLCIIKKSFGESNNNRIIELEEKYKQAIETAKSFGAPNPGEVKPVMDARAELDAAKDTVSTEAEIYDHLYRFFERYYDDGDFLSRRYYSRETSAKASPYAIPYNGEEVKLVWANMDQYYIKSSEYFANFSFDLMEGVKKQLERNRKNKVSTREELTLVEEDQQLPLRVHFKIAEATEGEHGNVKASDSTKRFFIIHKEKPVEFNEKNELVVNFEYRPDPEKTGQEGSWKDKRNAEAVDVVLGELSALIDSKEPDSKSNRERTSAAVSPKTVKEYLELLSISSPTDKDKTRLLLARYVNQYTARNTMDYFIHKDLGGFLRRELDFYIKNEVMNLDDIENADVPAVESYLSKIRVLRSIAGRLIDFLAQLEDFQKKLWLKKKFIVETNYCITLDRVPEDLYPDIVANEAQCEEWIKLFAIDEIEADLINPGFSSPLTIEFLKANDKLVLDTRFFDEAFKAKLLSSIENFDDQCDGLLIHSENFQALNLLQERYREQVKCVYIDPPYNTGGDGFAYKDAYRHSSWLSFLTDRVTYSKTLLSRNGLFFSSIDFVEEANLKLICDDIFSIENFLAKIIWEKRFTRSNNAKLFSTSTESILSYRSTACVSLLKEPRNKKADSTYSNPDNDPRGVWTSVSYVNPASKDARQNLTYSLINPLTREEVTHPTNAWKYEKTTYERHVSENRLYWGQSGGLSYPRLKKFLSEMDGMVPVDLWKHDDTGTTDSASKLLENEFGEKVFEFPKPPSLMKRIISLANFGDNKGTFLDFYAGTAPTAHAVINLNREDGGGRKYILVEMGDYFDTVLKPRIAKVVYSENWKNGKPAARQTGISHCFKYLRLESYEDTLNNLVFEDNPVRSNALESSSSLKEDYMLRYMLDVETRRSQSLLNLDAFNDLTAYKLKCKKPGSDEYVEKHVDLIETFSFLIGLRLEHIEMSQSFTAEFERIPDPELPEDQNIPLAVKGWQENLEGPINKGSFKKSGQGTWWFRKLEGWVPADSLNPDNGVREKVLILWRKLTGDLEKDNLMLNCWFKSHRTETLDSGYDIIYINGSNNLSNLRKKGETWEVRLIEEEFMKRMWEV